MLSRNLGKIKTKIKKGKERKGKGASDGKFGESIFKN